MVMLLTIASADQFKCHNKVDMVILLDVSGSIKVNQFKIAKKFAADLVKHFDISKVRTNVAIASYSQYVKTGRTFYDDASQEAVLKAIDGIHYEGAASRLDLAFGLVQFGLFSGKQGARICDKGVKKVAVFVTDGKSTRGVEFTRQSADSLIERGITLFSVAVSDHVDEDELNELASTPRKSHQLVIDTPGKFFTKEQVERFAKEICKID